MQLKEKKKSAVQESFPDLQKSTILESCSDSQLFEYIFTPASFLDKEHEKRNWV